MLHTESEFGSLVTVQSLITQTNIIFEGYAKYATMLPVAYATMFSVLRKYGLREYGLFKTLDKHASPTNCVRLMLVYCQSGPFYFYNFVGMILIFYRNKQASQMCANVPS